jgi:predicted PurR-regulated permease PerM
MTALVTTTSASVVIAVLAAAVLHATWNAIAHAVRDRLIGLTLIGIVSAVGGAVIAMVAARPNPASWGFLAAWLCCT